MLFYSTRAKQLNIFNEIRLSSEDLQAVKSLIQTTGEFATND